MPVEPQNIFSEAVQEQSFLIENLSKHLKSAATLVLDKTKDILSRIQLSGEATKNLSLESQKLKELIKQNKQAIFGISLVVTLFIVKQRISAKKRKQEKRKHILSLASSPINQRQRQHLQNKMARKKKRLQNKAWSKGVPYLRNFISEQQESECDSENESKDNPDMSSSTRRTQSVVSDMQLRIRRKPKKLQPILDLVQQEEQQDRVFFEMYKTYRQA